MKSNHIPTKERIQNRVDKLEARYNQSRVKGRRGNPYMRCMYCDIHDPELSIQEGKHFGNCPAGGLLKQISYWEKLLKEIK